MDGYVKAYCTKRCLINILIYCIDSLYGTNWQVTIGYVYIDIDIYVDIYLFHFAKHNSFEIFKYKV